MTSPADRGGGVRLDRWLWAARFFKTRSLAADAIAAGRVDHAGQRVKRAKIVQIGDELRIRKGPFEHVVIVRRLSQRRGPAAEAGTMYEETAESQDGRAKRADELRTQPSFDYRGKGRPTKKDRRTIDRLKRRR